MHHFADAVSPESAARLLAYIQRYTPPRRGQFAPPPTHLRQMSTWLGQPLVPVRSVRSLPRLAAHLLLFEQLGWIADDGPTLQLYPDATAWLYDTTQAQLRTLQRGIAALCDAHEAIHRRRLEDCLTVDYLGFLQQRSSQQTSRYAEPECAATLAWRDACWVVTLPPTLPLWLTFHLLQIGAVNGSEITVDALSLYEAQQRGYGADYTRYLLETALMRELDHTELAQLDIWAARGTWHTLQPVWLLETAQPDQFAALQAQRTLRRHMVRRLSPRHAVVAAEMVAPLRRRLARQGMPLNCAAGDPQTGAALRTSATDEWAWLALRVLAGLSSYIPPLSPPSNALQALAGDMSLERRHTLAAHADRILAQLQRVIAGKDAFFPADRPDDPHLVARIEQAIADGTALWIDYRGPGENEPRRRVVEPHQLEERGGLRYLHGYCRLAEADRTFRLDRIHAIVDGAGEP